MKDFLLISLLAAGCLVLIVLILRDTGRKGDDVKTEMNGDVNIVEIETRGERHEYLFFHCGYGKSLCHLPNCSHCKQK